jgi:hypothetical protein
LRNWLSVEPDTGLVAPGDTLTLQVGITADTTDDRTYEFFGNLHVVTNSCPDSAVTIPVTVYTLDVENRTSGIPTSFSLSAYPNPFNPRTTITLAVPITTHIKLSIYDVTGRCVSVLTDKSYPPGLFKLPFDAGSLPSGLYFAHIASAMFRSTQKLMLIK